MIRISKHRRLMLGVVALALLAGVTGCGNGDDDDSEDFDPGEVITEAADQLAATDTFHFELTHENGSTEIIQDMELTRAEGDVQRPDRLRADLEVMLLGQTLEVQAIGIGDEVWISNPFDPDQWQIVPDTSVDEVLSLTALPDVLRSVEDAQAAGTEEIEGQPHYRVTATVPSDSLEAVIPAAAQPGQTVEVEIMVGQEDGYTRRLVLQGPLNDDEPEDIERELQLSGFDESITIKPPE